MNTFIMGQWGSMTTTSFTAGALPAQTTVKFISRSLKVNYGYITF